MELLVDIHSVFRWLVLFLGVDAILLAILAAVGSRPWDRAADLLAFLFPLSMDIQALIGILVWALGNAWAGDAFRAWVHPALALAAVGLAHVGKARSERAEGPKDRGKQAAIFFVLSVVVALLAIPTSSWPL